MQTMQKYTDNNNSKTTSKTTEHDVPQGIQRYYQRTVQGRYANNYYLEPRETCPLDVLNDRERFVVLAFDKLDGYIVVNQKRYYLTRFNSIKGTDHVASRIAIVDIKELEHSKAYDFDPKYARRYTSRFKDFDELKELARQQWLENGTPYVKQVAMYNETTKKCSYYYSPSFRLGARKVG